MNRPLTAKERTDTRRADLADRVRSILSTAPDTDALQVLCAVMRPHLDPQMQEVLDEVQGISVSRGIDSEAFYGHAHELAAVSCLVLADAEAET